MSMEQAAELFDRLLRELEEKLAPQGYRITKEQRQERGAGHLYSVLEGDDGLVRLIWDSRQSRFSIRLYRRRGWLFHVATLAVRGKHQPEKLVGEWTMSGDEASRLPAEELLRQAHAAVLGKRTGG